MFYVLIILAVLCAAVFIYIDCVKDKAPASLIAKAAASFCFVALSAYAVYSSKFSGHGNYGNIILLGLVAGLIGDILLAIFDPAFTDKTGAYLPAGMIAFSVEHFLLITAVTLASGFSPLYMLLLVVGGGAVISSVIIIGGKYIMKLDFGKYMLPSWLYAGVLSGALVYYVVVFAKSRLPGLFVIGMVLFFFSDIVLSTMYFGGKNKSPLYKTLNLSTYYAGQILFAVMSGVAFFSAPTATIV